MRVFNVGQTSATLGHCRVAGRATVTAEASAEVYIDRAIPKWIRVLVSDRVEQCTFVPSLDDAPPFHMITSAQSFPSLVPSSLTSSMRRTKCCGY
jgi:hypothetical protein